MSILYDGDGRRVKETWTREGGTARTTFYVYDALGQLAAEYGSGGGIAEPFYPFVDQLGSVRMVTDSTGTTTECDDYRPFGQMLGRADQNRPTCYPDLANPSRSSVLPQKFTGKERDEQDQEPGLDFFGARYYSGAQGRFTSPDPSRLSALIDNPQSWNQYAYAYNEPFQFVDRSGRWPTRIHNQIIDVAFPNLTLAQRQILKEVSRSQDNFQSMFDNSLVFQHALRAPGQSVTEARSAYNAFVSDHLSRATQIQINFWAHANPGLSDDALRQFAVALHALMDSTSPAHFAFQEWNLWRPRSVAHVGLETTITRWELDYATRVARESFNQTFGGGGLFNPFDLLELLSRQNSNGNLPTVQTGSTSVCITYLDGRRECY